MRGLPLSLPTPHIAALMRATVAALSDVFSLRKPVSTSLENAGAKCLAGKSVICLSSPICKNISVLARPKSTLELPPSCPTEGRLAIVTDAGRDAVDAIGASDESA